MIDVSANASRPEPSHQEPRLLQTALPWHHSVTLQVKLKQEMVDIAYPPIVQSGGKYDLKVGCQSALDRSIPRWLCRCSARRA